MNTASLDQIETLAKAYAAKRAIVSDRVTTFDAEVRTIRNRLVPGIKKASAEAADIQAELIAAIQGAAELFEKPRTRTLHGIKVGFQKGKGKLSWDDEAKVLAAIKRLYPDSADALIKVKEKPIRAALEAFAAADLRKLGITVEETGDFVFVKASDSEIDKLVATILGEGQVEELEE